MAAACEDKAECGAAGTGEAAVDHKAAAKANTAMLCATVGFTLLFSAIAAAVGIMIAVLATATPFVAPLVFGAVIPLCVCVAIVHKVHALNSLPTWTERQAACARAAQLGFFLAAVVSAVCCLYIVFTLGSVFRKDGSGVVALVAFTASMTMCGVLVAVFIVGGIAVFFQGTFGEARQSASASCK